MELYIAIFFTFLIGILLGIWLAFLLISRGRKVKKAPPIQKPRKRKSAEKKEPAEGEPLCIRERLPQKEDSWTDLTCAAEGQNEQSYILARRKSEDRSYSILNRFRNR